MKVKFTENDKKVLKLLLEGGRMSCTEMAEELGITSQAVGRIKEKLEKTGIIKGYTTTIDQQKIGIEVIAIALFKIKTRSWRKADERDVIESMESPHMIRAYRFPEGDNTHMIVYGFADIKEMDGFFHALQTDKGESAELKKLYVMSTDSIMKDSENELLIEMIDGEAGKLARPELPKPFATPDGW